VIVGDVGKEAMKLAARVAVDLHLNNDVEYLITDKDLMSKTNICQQSGEKTTFCKQLHTYVTDDKRNQLFHAIEEPHERVTRAAEAAPFTMEHAKQASDSYIDLLWNAIARRLATTDMSASACAFSEAPAESVFQGKQGIQFIRSLYFVSWHSIRCSTSITITQNTLIFLFLLPFSFRDERP
jgi:hypothetical protein